jgi:hypothetical protein
VNAPELVQRGYDQYPDGIFRIARLYYWQYVVCGPKLIKDIGSAPDNIISFREAIEEVPHISVLTRYLSQPGCQQTLQGLLCFVFSHRKKFNRISNREVYYGSCFE